MDNLVCDGSYRSTPCSSPESFTGACLLDDDEETLNSHGEDNKREQPYCHELPKSNFVSDQGKDRKEDDDQREEDGKARDQEEAEFVYPATDNISDEDDARKDPESIEKSSISKGEGHEDRHEDPEGWKAH